MRTHKLAGLAMALVLGLTSCETGPNADTYCGRNPWVCGGGAVAAIVAVSALIVIANRDNGGGWGYSDERLKRDISYVGNLPNGLPLYAFRYWNDDRTFVGVMAQDLLEDERFSYAVVEDESGYYVINLDAAGLGVVGSRKQFKQAGLRAMQAAVAGF